MSSSTDDIAAPMSKPGPSILKWGVLQIWAAGVGGFDGLQALMDHWFSYTPAEEGSWVHNVSFHDFNIILFRNLCGESQCPPFASRTADIKEQLAKDLESWEAPSGEGQLLQYVDDLQIATKTQEACLEWMVSLLNFLGLQGYRVSQKKAQMVKQTVIYSGYERFLKYQAIMVEQDDVEIVVTNIVNPASFLSGSMGEPVIHECLETIDATYSSCPDLKDTLLENIETWSTNGSSYVISGRHAGYVVTTSREVIESGPLPTNTSAQKAEITALTWALELAKGKKVNFYTDSSSKPQEVPKKLEEPLGEHMAEESHADRLTRAIELQVKNEGAQEQVLEEMALADGNEWCKAAILSLSIEPASTLHDMLQFCLSAKDIRYNSKGSSGQRNEKVLMIRSPGVVVSPVVYKGSRGGHNVRAVHHPFSQATIRDLCKAHRDYGQDSPYFRGLLRSDLEAAVVIPADLRQLFSCLMDSTEFKLWEAAWRQLLREALPSLLVDPETAIDENGNALTLEQLMGEGRWTDPTDQASGIPIKALMVIREHAVTAFFGMVPDGPVIPYYMIIQGTKEAFTKFVERLTQAIEVEVAEVAVREGILREMVFANVNNLCRNAILSLPLDPPPTIQDMLRVCQLKVPFMQGYDQDTKQRTPRVAAISGTQQEDIRRPYAPQRNKCVICWEPGHWANNCPLRDDIELLKKKKGGVPTINQEAPRKRYHWRVLPQGMKNSPVICQWYVASLLSPVRAAAGQAIIHHYMDDVLVCAPTDDVLSHALDLTINALIAAGFELQEEKVQRMPPWKYLGLEIGKRTIVPQKLAIKTKVSSLADVHQLCGALNWVRPWLGLTTEDLAPLFNLLKGGEELSSPRALTPEVEKALERIQDAMSSRQAHRFDPELPFKFIIMGKLPHLHGMIFQWKDIPKRDREGNDPLSIIEWVFLSHQRFKRMTRPQELVAELIRKARSHKSVLTWKDPQTQQWEADVAEVEGSPQVAELAAVVRAFERFSEPFNLVTDSAYVAGVVSRAEQAILQEVSNIALYELLSKLVKLVSHREQPFFVMHTRSHTDLPGFIAEGNRKADALAAPAEMAPLPNIFEQAKLSHQLFHQNAPGLVCRFHLMREQAKAIVAACPSCSQHAVPTLHAGVNPRGLRSCEVWQTDVTHFSQFGRQKYIHVSIDTFSGAVFASAHTGEKAGDVIKHLIHAFSFLGVPKELKTDNGPVYKSRELCSFLQQWGVEHKTGIPHSPTGQAMVERTHSTIKRVLHQQQRVLKTETPAVRLARALFTINFLNCSFESLNPPIARHFGEISSYSIKEKPSVMVRDPETGRAEGPHDLVTWGRGYACVSTPTGPRWIPSKWVRPYVPKGSGSKKVISTQVAEAAWRRKRKQRQHHWAELPFPYCSYPE
ncbi:hypothetical protein DUI87_19122 [Hirundo rustica rustica]|uniref:Uncharacterized protein n=1 Tax=Hirundo rustica rustica TaxID=333673 RepID=A0A3M0JTE2_HIRRU|nr:hypothetical protein DUI87_19122 [Hirundo rustica rustica]